MFLNEDIPELKPDITTEDPESEDAGEESADKTDKSLAKSILEKPIPTEQKDVLDGQKNLIQTVSH